MRTITDHIVNGLNEKLVVAALDKPGPGGANHKYSIRHIEPLSTEDPIGSSQRSTCAVDVWFQNGPIKEAGENGVSNEALIAIVIDRIRGFQHKRKEDGSFDLNSRGEYACKENDRLGERVNVATEAHS